MTSTEELQAPKLKQVVREIEKQFYCKMSDFLHMLKGNKIFQILTIISAEDMNAKRPCGVFVLLFSTHVDTKSTHLSNHHGHLIYFLDLYLTRTHHSGSGQHIHVMKD